MATKNEKFTHAKELIALLTPIEPSDYSTENMDKLHFGQKCAWCADNAMLWLAVQNYKKLHQLVEKLKSKGVID